MPKSTERNPRESQLSRRQALRVIAGAGASFAWMASADRVRADEPSATKQVVVWTRPERSAAELRALGVKPEGIDSLVAAFRRHLEQGRQPGAQLAIYRNGKLVIEMGGGIARKSPMRPVTPQTTFVLFSCTKPWAATVAHILIERGKLKLQAKVADYWPEFAKKGKGDVTVYHALAHRGGYNMASLDLTHGPPSTKVIEETRTNWKPGEANGYNGVNFGYEIRELVKRVDGRDIQTFLQQEVFEPLKMKDSYLGLPDRAELEDRVAYVYEMERRTPGAAFKFGNDKNPSPPEWKFVWNRPEVHRMVIPSGSGISTANDYARFYGMLANGGEIDGVRVLKKETIDTAIRRTNAPGEMDRGLRMPLPWGLGFMLGGEPKAPVFGEASSPRTFGHIGAACVVGWGDTDRNLSFAYLTNGNLSFKNCLAHAAELGDLARKACK